MTHRVKTLAVLSAGAALSLVSLFSFVAPVHAQPLNESKAEAKAERIAARRAAAKAERIAVRNHTTVTPAQIAADQAHASEVAGVHAEHKYDRTHDEKLKAAQATAVDKARRIADRRAEAKAIRIGMREGKPVTGGEIAADQAKAGRIAARRALAKYDRHHNHKVYKY